MEFAILGQLEVRVGGRRVELSSAKERLLLTVLVLHAGEVVSTDRLIEVLWGDNPPATAGNTVQTYVSHLRKALEPGRVPRARDGVLRTQGPGYTLAVEPRRWTPCGSSGWPAKVATHCPRILSRQPAPCAPRWPCGAVNRWPSSASSSSPRPRSPGSPSCGSPHWKIEWRPTSRWVVTVPCVAN